MKTQKELMLEIDGPNGILNKSKVKCLKRPKTKFETTVFWTCMVFIGIIFLIATWEVFNPATQEEITEYNNIVYGHAQAYTIEAQVVPAQPASIEETPELPPQEVAQYSNNSVYNWQFAVDRWNECKNDVSFYQDWVNWYGEESAMRMCIISHSENGSRDPNKVAWNGTSSADVGLFQINTIHCGKINEPIHSDSCIESLKDPDTNLMVARQIYEAQGWSPWVARNAYMPSFHTDRLTLE